MKTRPDGTWADRPYERCLACGAQTLTDAQLLAVIIKTGVRGKSATMLAEQVLQLPGDTTGLLGICHLSVEELMRVPGIGEVKAIQIQCVGELSRRIATRRAGQRLSFKEPGTIADYYMEQLRHKEQEHLICMMLDTKNQLLGDECISVGTVNSAVLSTRELFLAALKYHAVHIVLVHNHPSGDPTPSGEDIRLTQKVRAAGALLNIYLLDHIVIGDCCYISFAEHDWMEESLEA